MKFISSSQFLGLAAASLLLAGCGGGSDTASSPTEYCVVGASVPPAAGSVVPPTFTLAALTTAESSRFAGSGQCASCHRADSTTSPVTNFDTATGEQVDLTADWSASMMANSARDPYFHAVLSAEIAANPDHSGAIQGKCLTCHAPMAAYDARAAGGSLTLADLQTSDLGKDGVSCTLCHRIEPDNLGPSGASYTGNFIIGNETGSGRKLYGPYANVAANPMINQVAFTPVQGAHVRDSKLCGACHNLITEAIDPENPTLPTGIKFPEQMPYKEWLASSYSSATDSKSCQSCHMPETVGGVRLANLGPNRTQSPFGKHHFVGANSFMLTMLEQNRDELGVAADNSAFDAAIVLTRNNLTQKTARLDANLCRLENTLTLPVTVTNLTGHKFPTGYPNRRAWLHVKVVDGAGKVVFESGNYGADGEIVGLAPGTMPHYDAISQSGQVQIYETVMGDVRRNPTRRLMHAAYYLKDNRLLPEGMSPSVTDTDIQVVGIGSDPNFIGGSDRVTYSVDTTGYTGPFAVTVELLYQTAPPRDVAALTYTTSQITRFKSMYAAANRTPERVASVTLNVR